ncbi:hypothetical protein DXG03_000179 [Asterophora parasitica]|uniref:Uncharacterized protein n=1 Tax=Asterophora parasitica TaxID=117018 RepID=A0A9P7GGE3_9AGAR|nr:hypothetical protein DXG03_000179 [Asterophora parasitica]
MTLEPPTAHSFRKWFTGEGGDFHPNALFSEGIKIALLFEISLTLRAIKVPSGYSIIAREDLPIDTAVVKCPFDLAITEELAQRCLLKLTDLKVLVSSKRWGDLASETPSISLVLHNASSKGEELVNNYGAKPNSELILGYGFSLSQNPDDTIVLKIGGIDGKKWEVGRSARGADGLWDEILHSVQQDPESPPNYEDQLDASGALLDMLHGLLDRLPSDREGRRAEMRQEVALMLHDYVEGQRDILQSLVDFAHEQEKLAIEAARAEGVEIVLED